MDYRSERQNASKQASVFSHTLKAETERNLALRAAAAMEVQKDQAYL
jgi:hypothetical protein